jgi:FkbM family methyltransferase
MAFLTDITNRLNSLALYLENPQLFTLRQRRGLANTFLRLNQQEIKALNIKTVIDIGANIGQFASTINLVFPQAQIYSFEPIPECFEQLKHTMQDVKHFTAFNLGIGDDSGELHFELNDYSVSSSFLKMTNLHKQDFPHTKNDKSITVKIERLDSIAENLSLDEPIFIKIDTQGYEDRVLLGGEKTIKRASAVIIETSFVELYEGQPLFSDIYSKLVSWGFSYSGALDQLNSPTTGKCLQEDSLFLKNS